MCTRPRDSQIIDLVFNTKTVKDLYTSLCDLIKQIFFFHLFSLYRDCNVMMDLEKNEVRLNLLILKKRKRYKNITNLNLKKCDKFNKNIQYQSFPGTSYTIYNYLSTVLVIKCNISGKFISDIFTISKNIHRF